jgi:hypothetical protein
MSPNCELPVAHFISEKSSLNEAGRVVVVFVFARLAFALVLRFATRLLVFALLALLFEFELMLASASSITVNPIPMIPRTAMVPSTHQTALDFLRGNAAGVTRAAAGVVDHSRGCDISGTWLSKGIGW